LTGSLEFDILKEVLNSVTEVEDRKPVLFRNTGQVFYLCCPNDTFMVSGKYTE